MRAPDRTFRAGGRFQTAEPLEITLKHGGNNHDVIIEAGDVDAGAEAKDRINFIIDVHVASGESKKRTSTRPATPAATKPVVPKPTIDATNDKTGGAK